MIILYSFPTCRHLSLHESLKWKISNSQGYVYIFKVKVIDKCTVWEYKMNSKIDENHLSH